MSNRVFHSSVDAASQDPEMEVLLHRYFDETLTLEEAEKLLVGLKASSRFEAYARDNLFMDQVLRFFGDLEKKPILQSSDTSLFPQGFPFFEDRAASDRDPLDLNLLIRLAAESPSLPSSPVEKISFQDQLVVPSARRKMKPLSKNEIYRNAGIVLLLICAMIAAVYHEFFSSTNTASRSAGTFVRVADMIDVDWNEAESLKQGVRIGREKIRWNRGFIKLDFSNGAELILEGPAEFVVNGKKRVFCQLGKVNVHVPDSAHGFELMTPFGGITDLGTEFSVIVGEKSTDLHVLSGKVEHFLDKNDRRPLIEGQAIRSLSDGTEENIPPDRFVCIDRRIFGELRQEYQAVRTTKRESEERRWTGDVGFLAGFDNKAFHGAASGTIRGGRTVKIDATREALRLRSSSDRIDFDLSGRQKSLSLFFLFRPYRLEHVSRLLISDRYYTNDGSILWQLDRTGALQFHIQSRDKASHGMFAIPGVIGERDMETWTTLAVTIDGSQGHVSQFKDGRNIGSFKWENPIPLEIGTAALGNEIADVKKETPRYLDADIGCLMIFNRALSPAEIAELDESLR